MITSLLKNLRQIFSLVVILILSVFLVYQIQDLVWTESVLLIIQKLDYYLFY
jgi:uncharacterized membrane protein